MQKHEVKVGDKFYGIKFSTDEKEPCAGWCMDMEKCVGKLMRVTSVRYDGPDAYAVEMYCDELNVNWVYNLELLLEKQPKTQALPEVVKWEPVKVVTVDNIEICDKLFGIKFDRRVDSDCPMFDPSMEKHVGKPMVVSRLYGGNRVRLECPESGAGWAYPLNLLIERQPKFNLVPHLLEPVTFKMEFNIVNPVTKPKLTVSEFFPVLDMSAYPMGSDKAIKLAKTLERFITDQREDRDTILYLCDYLGDSDSLMLSEAINKDTPEDFTRRFGVIGWLAHKIGHKGGMALHDMVATILGGVNYSRIGVDALAEEQFIADYRIELARRMIAQLHCVVPEKPTFAINIFRDEEGEKEMLIENVMYAPPSAPAPAPEIPVSLMSVDQLRDGVITINNKIEAMLKEANVVMDKRKLFIGELNDKGFLLVGESQFPKIVTTSEKKSAEGGVLKAGDCVRVIREDNSDGPFARGKLCILRENDKSGTPYKCISVDSDGDVEEKWFRVGDIEFVAR